jgi:hypothetical protein
MTAVRAGILQVPSSGAWRDMREAGKSFLFPFSFSFFSFFSQRDVREAGTDFLKATDLM